MKERWPEMLEYEQKVEAERTRDFVWRALGGHENGAVIEATTEKILEIVSHAREDRRERTWTREEVIQILDAAHREGAATIKYRFLAGLPLTWEDRHD